MESGPVCFCLSWVVGHCPGLFNPSVRGVTPLPRVSHRQCLGDGGARGRRAGVSAAPRRPSAAKAERSDKTPTLSTACTGRVTMCRGFGGVCDCGRLLVCVCVPDSPPSEEVSKEKEKEERECVVLWRRPVVTLYYFTLELLFTLQTWMGR